VQLGKFERWHPEWVGWLAVLAGGSRLANRPATTHRGESVTTTKIFSWLVGLVSTFALSEPLHPQTSSAPPVRTYLDSTALAPGDAVRITVWRKPELSGEFAITANGTVAHPLYREVQVAGMPLAAAERRLRAVLEKYEANPQFVVEPLLRVAVSGEVRTPNLYSLPPETSIAQAVALAGGATERGQLDRVRLVRQARETVINLRRPDATGGSMPVRSGDQIVVDRRTSAWDYIGPTVTVLGALAAVASVILYYGDGR